MPSAKKTNDKVKSPEQRNVSRENTSATTGDTQLSWDPFSDETRVRFIFKQKKKFLL